MRCAAWRRDQEAAERGHPDRGLDRRWIEFGDRSARPAAGIVDDQIRRSPPASTAANSRSTSAARLASAGDRRRRRSRRSMPPASACRAPPARRPSSSAAARRAREALSPDPAPTINARSLPGMVFLPDSNLARYGDGEPLSPKECRKPASQIARKVSMFVSVWRDCRACFRGLSARKGLAL